MITGATNQSLPNDSLIPLIFGEIHNIIHKINSTVGCAAGGGAVEGGSGVCYVMLCYVNM